MKTIERHKIITHDWFYLIFTNLCSSFWGNFLLPLKKIHAPIHFILAKSVSKDIELENLS